MAAIIGGALGSSIPNIFGGFAPFPNTIATALLAYQSEAIGFGFGIKFQYAKRLIGAKTNEDFNALTPATIGQIVEAHNTELINRMRLEMPKWLDIQKDFIEASVSVEIAKAERTPSAWAEIILAFSGAAGQQIADSLNALDPAALAAILAANPILALIYSFANTNGGTTPPPSEPPTEPEPLPEHIADPPDEHTEEEHAANEQEILTFQSTDFNITLVDPTSGSNRTYTTIFGTLAQHTNSYNALVNDATPLRLIGSSSWASNVISEYRNRINAFYKVSI